MLLLLLLQLLLLVYSDWLCLASIMRWSLWLIAMLAAVVFAAQLHLPPFEVIAAAVAAVAAAAVTVGIAQAIFQPQI